jgi:Uma2 family endonuclease
MTAEEFGIKHAGDHVEYVNGQVREIPMAGAKHGKVCGRIAQVVGNHSDARDLGHVFANDAFVRVPTKADPQRVYGADVAFVPYTLMPRDADVPDGVIPVTPPLVVEVRSPSDTWTAVFEKVEDYLGAGIGVVVIDPVGRAGAVHRPGAEQQTFDADGTLELPDVLPGFAVRVTDLFR